jgi:leucyl-tRNA synthetase
VSKLITLNNHPTGVVSADTGAPREIAEPLVLMIAPFTPHIAEELWARLGHPQTLAYADFPAADPALVTAEQLEYPVQVNGKVRARLQLPADAEPTDVQQAALQHPRVIELLAGGHSVRSGESGLRIFKRNASSQTGSQSPRTLPIDGALPRMKSPSHNPFGRPVIVPDTDRGQWFDPSIAHREERAPDLRKRSRSLSQSPRKRALVTGPGCWSPVPGRPFTLPRQAADR